MTLWLPAALAEEGKDLGGGWQQKQNEEGKVVQQLKIEAPAMTEEDQYGYTMPQRYRCDSCKAVMFHLNQGLRKRHPKSRRMKEWEYTDAFDDVCRSGFEGYGIKLIDGENALSGPGLPRNDKLAPGSGAIQMSSENWSKRLGEICRKIVFEKLGEDETYERFYKALRAEDAGAEDAEAGLSETLCVRELRECSTSPKPPPPKPAEEEKKAKKDKKDGKEKKEQKKEKREKKEKRKDAAEAPPKRPQPTAKAASPAAVGAGEEKVDVQTFLRNLAVRHGLTSDEYLASRTPAEWEKLTVAVAGRIFNRIVDHEPEESCAAKPWGSA